MEWFLFLLVYIGVACVWVPWKIWAPCSWALHVILDDADRHQAEEMRFHTFAQRTIDPRLTVPFSLLWVFHAALCLVAWLYAVLMFLAIRAWLPIARILGTQSPNTTTETRVP